LCTYNQAIPLMLMVINNPFFSAKPEPKQVVWCHIISLFSFCAMHDIYKRRGRTCPTRLYKTCMAQTPSVRYDGFVHQIILRRADAQPEIPSEGESHVI
jgi:hypothetical protein